MQRGNEQYWFYLRASGEYLKSRRCVLSRYAPAWRSAAAFSNYAALLAQEGHQEQALAAIDQALRLDPGHIAALVNRGLFHARKSEQAAALADYAYSLDGKETAQAYNNRGVLRCRQAEWTEAAADFDKAIETDAGLSAVWNNRALGYARAGRMKEAMQDMDKAIALSPKDAQLYAGRGFLYLRSNSLTQASQDFCRALTYNPKLFTAQYGMAKIALQEKRFAEALSRFEALLQMRSDIAPLYADMASCYERRGDVVKALRLYRQAVQRLLPRFNAPAYVLIADGIMERFRTDNSMFRPQFTWLSSTEYLLDGDTDAVSACVKESQAQMPADAWGYTRRGLVQMTLGNNKEALAQFDAALHSDVNFVPAYINRGTLHCRLGDMAAGLADYETALALDSHNALAHFNYGLLLEQEGKVMQAIGAYEKAIADDPNLAAAYLNLAVLYGKQGELTLAYKDCQKAISLQPENAITYNNCGILHERMGDYEAAQEDFSQAIMHAPNTAIIFANRGSTHNAVDAAADFSQALALDASCAPAYNNRALWHAARFEYTAAAHDLSVAIALQPEADIYFNKGIVALKTGRLQESVTLFSRAVELDEQATDAYYYRGIAYACILLLEQPAQVNRGFLYEPEHLWKTAMSDFGRVVNLQPNFARAYVWQSILYLYHNDLESARQAVERSMSIDKSAAAYCVRGVIYFRRKDSFSAALPMFECAITMDEQMLCAIALKACAYEKLQDERRALLTYQTLVHRLLSKNLELEFFLQETPLWEYEFINEEQNSLLLWK